MLDRCIDKFCDLGERNNLIELSRDFVAPHAENRAVEVDILTTSQFGMEPGADFQQRSDAPPHVYVADGWPGDTRKDFQQRTLARAVPTDNADNVAAVHFKRNILQ